MRIHIDQSSATPIYEQIRAGVAEAILCGDLVAGDGLPSIRALARDLRVSVITTTRAYNELVVDGLVDAVRGKGVFVRAQDADALRDRAEARIIESFAVARRAAELNGIARERLHRLLDDVLDGDEPDQGERT